MFKSRRENTGMESEVETKSITEIVVVKDTGMETKSKTVIEAVRQEWEAKLRLSLALRLRLLLRATEINTEIMTEVEMQTVAM